MIVTIYISQRHIVELERIARESYPAEACALLEGTVKDINSKSSDQYAIVMAVIRMHNADESIYSFRIDSKDLINAYQEISSRNNDVVGIFHSHPSKPYPSLTDVKFMELNPVVWLIYSTLSQTFAAYVLDHEVIEIRLESSTH